MINYGCLSSIVTFSLKNLHLFCFHCILILAFFLPFIFCYSYFSVHILVMEREIWGTLDFDTIFSRMSGFVTERTILYILSSNSLKLFQEVILRLSVVKITYLVLKISIPLLKIGFDSVLKWSIFVTRNWGTASSWLMDEIQYVIIRCFVNWEDCGEDPLQASPPTRGT